MPGLHMSAYAQPGPMNWSIPQYPAVMATQPIVAPGLKFFIERDNGSLVPLVPVDELPDDVRLVGVPQRLSASQTMDMLFLGHHSSARGKFPHDGSVNIKESIPPPSVTMQYTSQSGVAPHNNRVLQPINTQPVIIPASAAALVSTSKPHVSPKPTSLYNERPLPPSGIEPDQRKKVYCTYWIQNQGQCAYKQQGCMYRHEMPEDKETLNSIGLKSVPAWWRKEQARKKQKVKRTERNGSSSEWEVVGRQQNDNSALHGDDPARVRVRVPPSRPAGSQLIKQVVQESRSRPAAQKGAITAVVSSGVATTSTSHLEESPPGGVQLGAAKTPIRSPPYFSSKKQTLESPIEEDLIDFDVLVPSSSPDTSYSSVESPVDQRSKAEATKVSGGFCIPPGAGVGRRSSNGGRHRRGSADKKAGNVTPPRQVNSMMKGKIDRGREKFEHGNGVSRKGRVKAVPSTEAKATGETDMPSDGEV